MELDVHYPCTVLCYELRAQHKLQLHFTKPSILWDKSIVPIKNMLILCLQANYHLQIISQQKITVKMIIRIADL